jgi:hypothetical protein
MQKEKSMFEKVLEFFKTQAGKYVILAFLLGVFFGWIVIGWGLWPVTWTDAGFVDLQEDYAQLAMKNAINGYAATADESVAIQTYLGFGEIAEETYLTVREGGEVSPKAITNFDAMLETNGILKVESNMDPLVEEEPAVDAESASEVDAEEIAADEDAEPTPDNRALNRIGLFLGILFILALLIGLGLAYVFLIPEDTKKSIQALLTRHPTPESDLGASEVGETPAYLSSMGQVDDASYGMEVEPGLTNIDSTPSGPISESTSPRRSPIERTVNYVHNDTGRSHLDQNFSLKDSDESGKTVLEYGIAMSDYVEIGGVTYALAFDVYLASHPERRTITRVMVNKDLLDHPEVLQRYEGKGEPIKIDQDYAFELETGKFRLNGFIVNADYVYDEKYGGNYIPSNWKLTF